MGDANCPVCLEIMKRRAAIKRLGELGALQAAIVEWAERTFPNQSIEAKVKHLVKEAHEIVNEPDNLTEPADVLLLLLHICKLKKISGKKLIVLAWRKLAVNKKRHWYPADADGCYHHVKEP